MATMRTHYPLEDEFLPAYDPSDEPAALTTCDQCGGEFDSLTELDQCECRLLLCDECRPLHLMGSDWCRARLEE